MKARYKKSNKKKYIIILSVVALLVGLLLVVAELTNVTNLYSREPKAAGPADKINYGPPTEQESKAGDDRKQNIVDEPDNELTTPPNAANVVITGAEQNGDIIEVTAFISNVYKDGTCTTKLEQGGNTVTKTTSAYRDVSTTVCTNPLIPRSEFPTAGDWKVTVSYTSSDGVFGQSESTVRIN